MAGGRKSDSNSVMVNSFQHPSCLLVPAVQVEEWTLKQVQGDDVGFSDD